VENPVLFVHGIGATGNIWKKVAIPGRISYFLSFSNRFAHPQNQVPELKSEIDRVLRIEGKDKVILVCHSMGGLVARRYLADNFTSHRVEKLILLSAPNQGSIALSFNWFPMELIAVGLLGSWLASRIWPLMLTLIGLAWEAVAYLRGVLLLSPAGWSMQPNSKFLKELNTQKLPTDIKYIAILSDTNGLPHRLVNLFLFREGGDGAVPISSQRLSLKSVPNFSGLNYSELKVDLPHFAIPRRAEEAVLRALES